MPRLETDLDRFAEDQTMRRLLPLFSPHAIQVRAPDLSAVDRFVVVNGRLRAALEIKTRKETAEQVRNYGGLMLKHRKLTELRQLAALLNVPVRVVFAFESGVGDLYAANPATIDDAEPVTPPRRRNYRGLACDEEPVVFLDWQHHLQPINDKRRTP